MLAWTSIQTGKNPGKHGLYNTVLKKENSYKHFVPNANDIKGATLFDYLTEKHECCSINFPVSYPPRKNKKITTISAWLAPPFSEYIYPEEISKKVKKIGYKIQPDHVHKGGGNFVEEVYEATDKRFEALDVILKYKNPEFISLVITGSEHLHHNYASFIDPKHPNHKKEYEQIVKKYYEHIDRKIEELYNKLKKPNLLIASDHGFAPSYGVLFLNNVLSDYGYFEKKKRKSLLGSLFNLLEKTGIANIMRNKIKFDLFKIMPKALEKKIKESRSEMIDADWKKTKAFCSGIMGDIRLNLESREPFGLVKREDYEKTRNEIIDKLKNDKKLDKYIQKVWKKEELFNGPYIKNIPDIFVEFKKQIVSSPKINENKLFTKERKLEGFHTMEGIFMAIGPDIKNIQNIKNLSIMDISPTILHLMKEKVPKDMDGKVISEIIKNYREIKYREPLSRQEEIKTSEDEEEKIKERLKSLGYM